MMVAVQLDKKDVFDRLFRWAKKYMQYQEGPMKGYFAWSLSPDGTIRGAGPASDGELYFITSLVFASNRWGNDGEINYLKEAQFILNSSWEKDGSEGIYPFIDKERHLINFTPDGRGPGYTDPSYHLPAFYEVWARWANDGRADFYRECAKASREYLHKSIDPETGLNPDTNNFDGSFIQQPAFFGRSSKPAFRFDSWRVPMNIALDYEWSCADGQWQRQYGEKIQNFFYSQGIDKFLDQYRKDGSVPEGNEILGAGGFRKLRHSIGLVATTAAASVMCSHGKSKEFVDQLWNAKHEPFDDGYFDAYYDGLLRLFAFMHLSGNYRVIFPK
jgi:oligosaccharide reducing-end xylanase